MKTILKVCSFLILLVASAKMSFASSLNGTISFGGAGTVTATGITFAPPSQANGGQSVTIAGTGDLSNFTRNRNANFTNNFTFAAIGSTSGGEVLFTVKSATAANQTLQFKVTSYAMVGGKIIMYGTLNLTNTTTGALISSNTAQFVYTNSGGGTFSGALTTAPEPNSLILLGTGLVAASVLMTRRRRTMGLQS